MTQEWIERCKAIIGEDVDTNAREHSRGQCSRQEKQAIALLKQGRALYADIQTMQQSFTQKKWVRVKDGSKIGLYNVDSTLFLLQADLKLIYENEYVLVNGEWNMVSDFLLVGEPDNHDYPLWVNDTGRKL
jgi:hypothetical protein